jgi:hypothetical protein
MNKLRMLALASLLALGVNSSLPAATLTRTEQATRSSYEDGFDQGFADTTGSKCSDGNRFENKYDTEYRPTAEQNFQSDPSDYNQGYLDGQSAGYDAETMCL